MNSTPTVIKQGMEVVDGNTHEVNIPPSFLRDQPLQPIIHKNISFANSDLPEYDGYTAFVLENVLSTDECKQLLALAEGSVLLDPDEKRNPQDWPWKPAMVYGPGGETLNRNYRNSGRIIWDEPVIAHRVWQRCAQVPAVQDALARVNEIRSRPYGSWKFTELNKRMRFLKYTEGQFFKPHTDGASWHYENDREFQTQFTLHLYLNDSDAINGSSDGFVGGSTAFLSLDRKRRLDVNPRAGSVLIFQHHNLLHEGVLVENGVKYTMRTDLLFEWVPEEVVKKPRPTRKV